MAVDLKRLAAVAVDTALNDERPNEPDRSAPTHRSALSGLRGVAAGAVIVTAARFAVKHAPSPLALAHRLPKPDLAGLGDRIRDQLDDLLGEEATGDLEDEADLEDEEDLDGSDEDYEEAEEEEEDEEPEADEDEEPEAEEGVGDDEDEDRDEPEAEADEDDFDEELDDDYDDEAADGHRLEPAARPPKPPRRRKTKAG
jgi:hypothetical protein